MHFPKCLVFLHEVIVNKSLNQTRIRRITLSSYFWFRQKKNLAEGSNRPGMNSAVAGEEVVQVGNSQNGKSNLLGRGVPLQPSEEARMPAGPATPDKIMRPHEVREVNNGRPKREMIHWVPSKTREKRKAEATVLDLTMDDEADDTFEDPYNDNLLFGCGPLKRKVEIAFALEEEKPRDVRKRIKIFPPHDSDPPRPVPWARLRKLEMINQARLKRKMPDEVYTHVRTPSLDESMRTNIAEIVTMTRISFFFVQEIQKFITIQQTIDRYLGPIFHGDRYTSFGRHFTKPDIMDKVIEEVMKYLAHGDMIVDMTCGANTFVPTVKRMAKEAGAKVWLSLNILRLLLRHCLSEQLM